jgi:hypothetical protein
MNVAIVIALLGLLSTVRACGVGDIGRTPDLRHRQLCLDELVGILSLGQDNTFGQPLESQFRRGDR